MHQELSRLSFRLAPLAYDLHLQLTRMPYLRQLSRLLCTFKEYAAAVVWWINALVGMIWHAPRSWLY